MKWFDQWLVFGTASVIAFLIFCKFTVDFNSVAPPFGLLPAVTPSVPIGLYRVVHAPLKHGQIVGFCPPPTAALVEWHERGYWYHIPGNCPRHLPRFMKPIAALPGDRIILDKNGMTVNGRLINNSKPMFEDEKHRPLTPYPFGKYKVQPGQVWLVSHYRQDSLDGRYFGPVAMKSIITPVAPVITMPTQTKQVGR